MKAMINGQPLNVALDTLGVHTSEDESRALDIPLVADKIGQYDEDDISAINENLTNITKVKFLDMFENHIGITMFLDADIPIRNGIAQVYVAIKGVTANKITSLLLGTLKQEYIPQVKTELKARNNGANTGYDSLVTIDTDGTVYLLSFGANITSANVIYIEDLYMIK